MLQFLNQPFSFQVSFSFPVEVISDNNHQLIPFGAVEHQHLLNSVLSEDHDDDVSILLGNWNGGFNLVMHSSYQLEQIQAMSKHI